MIRNCVSIEVEKGPKTYKFVVESDSSLGEVYDVLAQMKNEIYMQIKASEEKAAQEQKKPEEPAQPVE